MDALWFLQYLGLSEEADERSIKRAYAARLKRIDPSTDLDGFARLRQAYEQALSWRTARPSGADVLAPSMPAIRQHAAAPPPADDAPASPEAEVTPVEQARSAIERLLAAIHVGTPAADALDEQLARLRGDHLRAMLTFELWLIDGLASSGFTGQLALFRAARERFGWMDVTHLAQLGPRGSWIQRVMTEEMAWARQTGELRGARWFEWLEQGAQTAPPDPIVSQWPHVQRLLNRYPNYLRLRLRSLALETWKAAFDALPAMDRDLAEAYATLPSPRQHRQATPQAGRTTDSRGSALIAVMVLFAVFNLLRGMFGSEHAWQAPSSELHTTTAASTASATGHAPPPFDQLCPRLSQKVHAPGWVPPSNPVERQKLTNFIRLCLTAHDWPHWQMADPQLAKLGIST
ncbi:hypothetical protein [Frateuria defendens]|uniref:hypothetical protein n=1 Tax=Frateuria defendens TaxID=2219559 RepID=UPI00066FDA5A|nr:hypothetical protein [Frateuria defendens]